MLGIWSRFSVKRNCSDVPSRVPPHRMCLSINSMVRVSVKTHRRSTRIPAGCPMPENSHRQHQCTPVLTKDKSLGNRSLPGLSSDIHSNSLTQQDPATCSQEKNLCSLLILKQPVYTPAWENHFPLRECFMTVGQTEAPSNVVLYRKRAVTTSKVRGPSKAFLPMRFARKRSRSLGAAGWLSQ